MTPEFSQRVGQWVAAAAEGQLEPDRRLTVGVRRNRLFGYGSRTRTAGVEDAWTFSDRGQDTVHVLRSGRVVQDRPQQTETFDALFPYTVMLNVAQRLKLPVAGALLR